MPYPWRISCLRWRRLRLRKTDLGLSSYFGVLTLAHNTTIIEGTLYHFPVLDVLTPKAPGLLSRAFSADGHRRANACATGCAENDGLDAAWKLRSAASAIFFIAENGTGELCGGAAPARDAASAADAAIAIE